MEPIRRGIEGFLRGRYGYEGYRAFRVMEQRIAREQRADE